MTSVADHIRLKQSQDVSISGVREGRLFPKSLAALIFNSPESLAKQCHETTESEGLNTTLSSVLLQIIVCSYM